MRTARLKPALMACMAAGWSHHVDALILGCLCRCDSETGGTGRIKGFPQEPSDWVERRVIRQLSLSNIAVWRAANRYESSTRKTNAVCRQTVLRLPDLEQAKSAVLNSLTALDPRRGTGIAIDEFVEWYCSEPRLSFNRTVATAI